MAYETRTGASDDVLPHRVASMPARQDPYLEGHGLRGCLEESPPVLAALPSKTASATCPIWLEDARCTMLVAK